MFLHGNFLGVTPLFGAISIIPSVTSYDSFKFYGGTTGAIFSKIWGRNIQVTTEQYNEYDIDTYVPSWTRETYFWARFNNSLNAGNISDIGGTVQSWYLWRKEGDSDQLELIDILDVSNIEYYDFTILDNKTYQYYLFAQDETKLSSPILTNSEVADYYGWFLVDIENDRAYHFDIRAEISDKTYTQLINEHKTNNTTNAFTVGENFFIEGNVKAIISKDNEKKDVQYTNEDLLSLAEFINSDRPKLFKSRRGEIFRVFTYGYKEELLNPAIDKNIYISSFGFKEEGDL